MLNKRPHKHEVLINYYHNYSSWTVYHVTLVPSLHALDKREELVKLRNDMTNLSTKRPSSKSSQQGKASSAGEMGRGKRLPVQKRPFEDEDSDSDDAVSAEIKTVFLHTYLHVLEDNLFFPHCAVFVLTSECLEVCGTSWKQRWFVYIPMHIARLSHVFCPVHSFKVIWHWKQTLSHYFGRYPCQFEQLGKPSFWLFIIFMLFPDTQGRKVLFNN